MSDLEYPQELRYTAEHEWVRTGNDDVVRVGITSYAQDALGDVVYVDLPSVGDEVSAGDTCGAIESTKSVSDLFSPLTGEVVAVNESLESASEMVNSDPYGEGWMFEMKVADPGQLESLMDADAYVEGLD